MQKNGAALILFKNDRREEVFLVRRSGYHIWGLTGGGAEKGEKPIETALREAKEETGFKVKVIRFLGVYKRSRQLLKTQSHLSRKSYFFEGRVVSGQFKPEFPGCLGRWFPVNKLPLDITCATRLIIRDVIGHQGSRPFQKEMHQDLVWKNLPLLVLHPISALKYLVKTLVH